MNIHCSVPKGNELLHRSKHQGLGLSINGGEWFKKPKTLSLLLNSDGWEGKKEKEKRKKEKEKNIFSQDGPNKGKQIGKRGCVWQKNRWEEI